MGIFGNLAGKAVGAIPGLGTAAFIAQVLGDVYPLVRDAISSPTVDQDKVAKIKAARDNAASQLAGEAGVSYAKALEMVDKEFQPMIDQASQPQGGADAGTIAGDVGALALGVTGAYGASRLGKGAKVATDAVKDSSGVLAEEAKAVSKTQNLPRLGYRPEPQPRAGLAEQADAPVPAQEDPFAGKFTMEPSSDYTHEPDPEAAPAMRILMQQRQSMQSPPMYRQPPPRIGMEGMTPELGKLLQEYQDQRGARATPQGMRSRMYGREGD